MADLVSLVEQEIPEGRQSLQDSYTNLERVAEYCETNYYQNDNKRAALEETKNYTTQSLASVAYQINTLAYNFLHMLDLQTAQMSDMDSQINHIAQLIMIHKEKVARREIGILTTNKSVVRQHKIVSPQQIERPIKYVRKPIDYGILDDIGHGIKIQSTAVPRSKRGGSISSNTLPSAHSMPIQSGTQTMPPPTTKPPTPPQPIRSMGSLSKGSREYRALVPPVPPPQVPSHYAPNYPKGSYESSTLRRGDSRGSGGSLQSQYGSLPTNYHGHSGGGGREGGQYGTTQGMQGHHTLPHSNTAQQIASQQHSQQHPVGTVHPMSHQQHQQQQQQQQIYQHLHQQQQQMLEQQQQQQRSLQQQHSHYQLGQQHQHTLNQQMSAPSALGGNHGHYGVHMPSTPPPPPLSAQQDYDRSVSPPLPPPPAEDENQGMFMAPYTPITSNQSLIYAPGIRNNPIAPNDKQDWIPKQYLEKVIAIYDYGADKDDELSFQENSVIYVLKKNDDGWYEGVMNGITGLFPGNYVEPCM